VTACCQGESNQQSTSRWLNRHLEYKSFAAGIGRSSDWHEGATAMIFLIDHALLPHVLKRLFNLSDAPVLHLDAREVAVQGHVFQCKAVVPLSQGLGCRVVQGHDLPAHGLLHHILNTSVPWLRRLLQFNHVFLGFLRRMLILLHRF
jgi:hypothetical protein